MTKPFQPYADEADVLRIGGLEVENRLDRVSITGEVVLTKDKAGLLLAIELQSLVDRVVKALQADSQIPQTVALTPGQVVKNPFS